MPYVEPIQGDTADLSAGDFEKFRDRGFIKEKIIEEPFKEQKLSAMK